MAFVAVYICVLVYARWAGLSFKEKFFANYQDISLCGKKIILGGWVGGIHYAAGDNLRLNYAINLQEYESINTL